MSQDVQHLYMQFHFVASTYTQVARFILVLTLVLGVHRSSWMISSVPQVLTSYLSVQAGQSCHTTVTILMMLVWVVKVCGATKQYCWHVKSMLTLKALKFTTFLSQLPAHRANCDW